MKNVSGNIIALPRRRSGGSRNRPSHSHKGDTAGSVRAPSSPDDAVATRPTSGHDAKLDAPPIQLPPAGSQQIERLYAALSHITAAGHPRTFKLLGSHTRKVAQKVIEEAGEVALEGVKHRADGVVRESADLIYHLVVLWCRAGIDPEDVWREMRDRADSLGLAEKRPKPARHVDPGSSGKP
jgi:phosphoribosyl-ATP pyrophosphohydrolase